MHEEPKSAQSDAKMRGVESAPNNGSALKKPADANANLPNSISNIEEDWKDLKRQNLDLNNEIRTHDSN